MNWLTSNLLLLAILAGISGVLFLASFVRLRVWVVSPNWIIFGVGAFLMVAFVIGVIAVVRGTPGQEETVEEKEPDGPKPALPDSAIERLRLTWDSEAPANWPVAETLAVLSETAYLPPVEAEKEFRQLGFSQIMPIVAGSMIGYIVSGEDVTVIVFRGTDFTEISDWFANAGITPTDTPHGQIHRGFYNAYLSMESQIDQILAERNTKHLWVTGHSLGGALALVCAYDLVGNDQREVDGVITFGQPLVARQQLAGYFDKLLLGKYARFVNGDDVVARIPSSHAPCGSLVWFTADGVRRSKPKQAVYGAPGPPEVPADEDVEIKPLSDEEFEELQARWEKANKPVRLPDGTEVYQATSPLIDDHSMSLYLEKIRKLLGVAETVRPPMEERD